MADANPFDPGDYLRGIETPPPPYVGGGIIETIPSGVTQPSRVGYVPPAPPELPKFDISGYLESNPQAAFNAFLQPFSANMRRFYTQRFGNIYGDYQAELARQAIGGTKPNLKFMDYLRSRNWMQDFFSYSPQQRGFFQNQYAPRARWLNY